MLIIHQIHMTVPVLVILQPYPRDAVANAISSVWIRRSPPDAHSADQSGPRRVVTHNQPHRYQNPSFKEYVQESKVRNVWLTKPEG